MRSGSMQLRFISKICILLSALFVFGNFQYFFNEISFKTGRRMVANMRLSIIFLWTREKHQMLHSELPNGKDTAALEK